MELFLEYEELVFSNMAIKFFLFCISPQNKFELGKIICLV